MLLSMIKAAFVQNLKPAIALQLLAVSLVVCYYFVPAFAPAFLIFSDLKSHYGIAYSIVSTAIFGGLIPYFYLLLSGQINHRPFKQFIFYLLLWAWMGICVDLLYGLQSNLFGNGNDINTLAKKVAFDQFIYAPFYAAPFSALMFLWKEQGFHFRRWYLTLDKQLFTLTLPANIVSNWMVWFPAVASIYAMPAPLQVPLFNVVLCFYVLLLSVLNKSNPRD